MPEFTTTSESSSVPTDPSHHRSSSSPKDASETPKSASIDLPPPTLPPSFEEAVDAHYTFHSAATRIPHRFHVSLPPTASVATSTVDRRISLSAKFLTGQESTFRLDEIPPKMAPFWAYKDFALYITGNATNNLGELFDRIYSEWYPTRDRTCFDDGILRGAGSPFASATMRVDWVEGDTASDANRSNKDHDSSYGKASAAKLLVPLIELHTSLTAQLDAICPQFEALHEGGARMLVRPGLSLQQQQSLPSARKQVEYLPVMQKSFKECFLWLDESWKEEGVKLVVLGEDMLSWMLFGDLEEVWRDVEFEGAVRNAMGLMEDQDEAQNSSEQKPSIKALLNGTVVFKDSLENAMRIVLLGDEKRKRGNKEWNPILEKWLGLNG